MDLADGFQDFQRVGRFPADGQHRVLASAIFPAFLQAGVGGAGLAVPFVNGEATERELGFDHGPQGCHPWGRRG